MKILIIPVPRVHSLHPLPQIIITMPLSSISPTILPLPKNNCHQNPLIPPLPFPLPTQNLPPLHPPLKIVAVQIQKWSKRRDREGFIVLVGIILELEWEGDIITVGATGSELEGDMEARQTAALPIELQGRGNRQEEDPPTIRTTAMAITITITIMMIIIII